MNEALFRHLNSNGQHPFLDRFVPLWSDKDFVVIPGIAAAILLFAFGSGRIRLAVFTILAALAVSDVTTEKVLKPWFGAPRPYVALDDLRVHYGGEWRDLDRRSSIEGRRSTNAYPSSHAANSAAFAAAVGMFTPASLIASIPAVFLIGWSRVYTGHHLPLDVLGGWIWGGVVAVSLVLVARRVGARWMTTTGETFRERWRAWPSERRIFLGILCAWVVGNFAYVHYSGFGLAGDEAQYWDWSRRLDLGYYSKPPLIAYIIRLFVAAGGNQEWSIRTAAVLLSTGTVAAVYALAARISGSERTALWAAGVLLALPMTWAGSVMTTPDAPLACAWAVAMLCFHRAIGGIRRDWWVAGLALGLGLLAKYTMAYLAVGLLLYLVLLDRRHLRSWGPYAMFATAALCLSGTIYWNAVNDWISFRHTAQIGEPEQWSFIRAASQFGEFVGGQFGVASPLMFALLMWGLWRCAAQARRDSNAAFLFLGGGLLFVSYAITSLIRSPEPNWPVCAYIAGAVAVAWQWRQLEQTKARRRFLVAAIALGVVLGLALRTTGVWYLVAPEGERRDRLEIAGLSIDPDNDPTNALVGGDELGAAISQAIEEWPRGVPFVFSDRYQLTALAAFYTKGRPRTYCMNLGDRRLNQYDLWGGWPALEEGSAIFVTGGNEVRGRAFVRHMLDEKYFHSGHLLDEIEVKRGDTVVKTYTISALFRYTGKPWPTATGEY